MTITKLDETKLYDMILVSQPKNKHLLNAAKAHCVINIIHSEYDFEKPILSPIIYKYVAIRPSIKEHLVKNYGIKESKIEVIYNGVDRDRFSPEKRKAHEGDFTKIVLPCTIDPLRETFINYYIAQANEKRRVFIPST